MNEIFRKKSIEKHSSPEQLNDYIRVTKPSVWIVLLAVIILLVGIMIWSLFGTVEVTEEDGTNQMVHPITFITN